MAKFRKPSGVLSSKLKRARKHHVPTKLPSLNKLTSDVGKLQDSEDFDGRAAYSVPDGSYPIMDEGIAFKLRPRSKRLIGSLLTKKYGRNRSQRVARSTCATSSEDPVSVVFASSSSSTPTTFGADGIHGSNFESTDSLAEKLLHVAASANGLPRTIELIQKLLENYSSVSCNITESSRPWRSSMLQISDKYSQGIFRDPDDYWVVDYVRSYIFENGAKPELSFQQREICAKKKWSNVKVTAVTALYHTECIIDLEKIGKLIRCAEYNPTLGLPFCRISFPLCDYAVSVFASGKIIISGAKTVVNSQEAVQRVLYCLSKIGYDPIVKSENYSLVGISAIADLGKGVDINRFNRQKMNSYMGPNSTFVEYYPLTESENGGCIASDKMKVMFSVLILVFATGKVVFLGGKSEHEISEMYRKQVIPTFADFLF